MVGDLSDSQHLLGALAALASAFCWALAAVIFSQLGETFKPRFINLFKGIIASICLLLLVLPNPFDSLDASRIWMLALSGVLGITIGDTLYFYTLNRLGARITLLVGTLIPVLTAIVAVLLFEERLGPFAWFGLALTLFGVSYVLWSKSEKSLKSQLVVSGIFFAILFVVTESSSILLTKVAVSDADSLQVTLLRQIWGIAGLTLWGLLVKDSFQEFRLLKGEFVLTKKLLIASVLGAFLGTWLSVLALKLTYASVAVSLNSTSPIFVLPISYFLLKQSIPRSTLIGAFISVLGIIIYFSQQIH